MHGGQRAAPASRRRITKSTSHARCITRPVCITHRPPGDAGIPRLGGPHPVGLRHAGQRRIWQGPSGAPSLAYWSNHTSVTLVVLQRGARDL